MLPRFISIKRGLEWRTNHGSPVESLLVAWFHLESLFTVANNVEVVVELEMTESHVEIRRQHETISLSFLIPDQHVLFQQVVDNA